jgi:predicted RNase H-like HicB family nuclease
MDPNWKPADTEPDEVIDGTEAATNAAARPARLESPSRIGTRARVLGALVLGGIGGAAILGPLTTAAASPTPSTATAPSATSGTGTDADGDNDAGHPGGPGGPGGHVEAVTDTSVVAKAIGISEADLKTALAGGQTVAAVAKAHNVALQVVIDALVADSNSELAAEVAAGTITQAQADAMKAQILQRATDQANGTFSGGPGGPGDRGPGGPGGFGHNEAVSDTSVVAKAIGISEADLKTALAGGQTVAAVAKAHNVALQVVIDALVADGTSELAAQVANGSITQAQADAMKAQVLQRATDQANGTFGTR